jgi:hypothetical protein
VYRAIIDAAVGLSGAVSVDLQVYDDDTDSRRIADHRGFDAQFLAFFADVRRSTPSACAVAWPTGASHRRPGRRRPDLRRRVDPAAVAGR